MDCWNHNSPQNVFIFSFSSSNRPNTLINHNCNYSVFVLRRQISYFSVPAWQVYLPSEMISLIAKRFLFTNQFSSHRSFLCWHRADFTSTFSPPHRWNQSVGVFPLSVRWACYSNSVRWWSCMMCDACDVCQSSIVCVLTDCVAAVFSPWRHPVSPSHPGPATQPPATTRSLSHCRAP